MDRYEKKNTASLVDGYFSHTPSKSLDKRFQEAKKETILALKKTIERIEKLDLKTFMEERI